MNPIELKDFLNYRFLSQPRYAPGGQRAAFVVANCSEEENSYESRLWLYDGALRQLTDLGKEGRFFWEDETHILFPAVRSAKEKKRAEAKEAFTSYYRLDITGGEALPAFTLPFAVSSLEKIDGSLYAAAGALDAACPDYYKMTPEERADVAKHYADEKDYEVLDESPFWFNGGGIVNKQRSALFLVDVETMEIRRVTAPLFSLDSFLILPDRILYTGEAYDAKASRKGFAIYALDPATGESRLLAEYPDLYGGDMILVGDRVLMSANPGERHGLNENNWIYTLNPDTGALTLLRQEEYSMHGTVGSDCRYGGGKPHGAKGDKLYHITTREGCAHLYVLNPDGSSQPVITKEGSLDSFAVCEEHNTALLIGLYDGHLQELYTCDLEIGGVTQVSHFNDAVLEGKYVAAPQPLRIESQGYPIGGWVLLPKDFDPSRTYPAVLDIHGGPKTVYGPVFYHEMQVWANMGYFVFYCNPKGGDGRDNEFMDIRGHYGETDYANLMDFTDAVLAKYPQIDKARVCVTGGSYGGFMTNWIIGHTDRFCCAASQRSISNWLSFYGVSDIGPYFAADQCGATPFEDPEKLWRQSPLRYAPNVKTPTLFIHSDEDYRCPLEQGIQMYTALLEHGVPARLCMFHGENHELSRSGKPKHRVRRLTEITDWFEKYSK